MIVCTKLGTGSARSGPLYKNFIMMKYILKTILAVIFPLLVWVSCEEEEKENAEPANDDAYYAEHASVTSSDANFTDNGSGGDIYFKTEGGTVTLSVSCGCDWVVENTAADLFSTSTTTSSLTVTAGQNTVEDEVSGTISLKTAERRITFATINVTQNAYGAPEISVSASEWNAPAVGTLTTEIEVYASDEWTAESSATWLTISQTAEGMILTAEENTGKSGRNTRITLTCTDGIKSVREYVTVTQDGKVYLTLSAYEIKLLSGTGSSSVTVESNYDWDYSYDSSNDWFTVSRNDNDLTVTAKETEEEHEATVTVTAGDGAENVTEAQLTISMAGKNALILTYTITSANTSARLPIYGTVDCTVDWGDGTVERYTSTRPSHTYAAKGDYDVIIDGTVTALYSSGISSSSSPLAISAVKQWGNTGLTDMNHAFYYCTSLASLPEYTGDAFVDVTDFQYAFCDCPSLKEIPKGIFDNCPKNTAGNHIFYGCSTITTIPEGLFDNWPEVTTFRSAFYECSSLTTIPAHLFSNCPKVTSFRSTFEYCPSLTEVPAGLFDGCSAATTFAWVFYAATSLKTISSDRVFGGCSSATTVMYAFTKCSALETIPAGLFDDCTALEDFIWVFDECSSLKSVPKGLFDNMPKVESFYCTFYACTSLEEIPEGLFDHCPEVYDCQFLFTECSSLKAIPKGLFDNIPKVNNFYALFYKCASLTEIPEGLFDNCPLVTNFSYALYACTGLSSVPPGLFSNNKLVTDFSYTFARNPDLGGESPYEEIDGVKVHLYERANYPDIYATPTVTTLCFVDDTRLTDYDNIPIAWR